MRSKFPGSCKCCGEKFPAGQEIEYVRGEGAYLPGHRPVEEHDDTPRPGDEELAQKLGYEPPEEEA